MRSLLEDFRHAVRALLKRPKLVAAIAIPLALGIGANSAIFGIVDATLFRPLPAREPDRLVRLFSSYPDQPEFHIGGSFPHYLEYRNGVTAFSHLAAYSDPSPVHVSTGGGGADRARCTLATGNYFEVLGVRASRGRTLEPADDVVGASRVAMLSDAYWRRRFGADPGAVGSAVEIGGLGYLIVGVAPAGFTSVDLRSTDGVPDIWIPVSAVEEVLPEFADTKPLTDRGFGWLQTVGRLAPGATIQEAQAQLDTLTAESVARLADARHPEPVVQAMLAVDAALDPFGNGENATKIAWLLFGIVGCVLLIGCADAAGLLMARGEERRREIAIRQAIGASRWRVVRQLMTESLLISVVASILGLVVAIWMTDAFKALASEGFLLSPEIASPVGGWRVLLFTTAAAMLVALLFGTIPSLRASRVDLVPELKSESRFASRRGLRIPLRSVSLVVQVGLSVVLLAGAGLLLRTLWNAYRADPGFEAEKLAVASVDFARHGYDEARGRQTLDAILENVRGLPGVRSASVARTVPMKQSGMIAFLEFEGVEPTPDEYADLDPVGPGFFSTLGVPILRGRDILATDTKDSQPVTVINSALAEKYWPGQDPIGKRLKSAGGKGAEVVGVVADFKMHSLREPAPPTLFVPAAQHYLPRMTIAVRSVGDPEGILSSIRTAVTRVDPSLAVFDTRTAEEQLGVLLAEERIVAWLLVTFAGLAAILTATGFYGAFAYHTRLRTREYAIRLALGARSGQLLSLVLMRGVSLAVTGVGLGIAVTYALSGFLASLLFGVAPVDPATFAAAALVLVGIPVVASFIPARRASRVDPAVALRDE